MPGEIGGESCCNAVGESFAWEGRCIPGQPWNFGRKGDYFTLTNTFDHLTNLDFCVTYHSQLKTAWTHLDDFCKLPKDTKEVYIRKAPDNHGYVQPGQEKFDGVTPELRHAFNICTLNAANLPEEPLPGFREHISDLATDFKTLSTLLLQALAIGLELKSHYFIDNHSHMLSGNHDNETTMRLLYYPPIIKDDGNKCEVAKGKCKYSQQRCCGDKEDELCIPKRDVKGADNDDDDDEDEELKLKAKLEKKLEETVTRCGAHCDYGTFTLLSQDSEGGLEVKLPGSSKWHRVGHLPGAILINTGEILSVWSQEKYPALEHRVIIPEQEQLRVRGRHSIAFFCHPGELTAQKPQKRSHVMLGDPYLSAYFCGWPTRRYNVHYSLVVFFLVPPFV